MAEHLMELPSYHYQCTSYEVCCQIWMVLSVISYFIKTMSQRCCSYIRLVATCKWNVSIRSCGVWEKRWHKMSWCTPSIVYIVVSMWNTCRNWDLNYF